MNSEKRPQHNIMEIENNLTRRAVQKFSFPSKRRKHNVSNLAEIKYHNGETEHQFALPKMSNSTSTSKSAVRDDCFHIWNYHNSESMLPLPKSSAVEFLPRESFVHYNESERYVKRPGIPLTKTTYYSAVRNHKYPEFQERKSARLHHQDVLTLPNLGNSNAFPWSDPNRISNNTPTSRYSGEIRQDPWRKCGSYKNPSDPFLGMSQHTSVQSQAYQSIDYHADTPYWETQNFVK